MTFEWFLSTVNSAMHNKVSSMCKSFPTNSTVKQFLSWVTSSVCCQVMTTLTTFATLCALVFTSMNIHMGTQVGERRKMFLTLSTWIEVFPCVSFTVICQMLFRCKPFVTHSTLIRPWLVITLMLRDDITISFSLYHSWAACTCTRRQTHLCLL